MGGMKLNPEFLALAAEVPRHFLEPVLEHCLGAVVRSLVERTHAFGFARCLAHLVGEFAFELFVPLGRPLATANQMLRQPRHWVAEGPVLPFVFGAVATRVVAG